jgi:hypothetical protein
MDSPYIIPLVCKNGLYDMKMGNLFQPLKLSNLMASRISHKHITLKTSIFSQIEEIQNKWSKSGAISPDYKSLLGIHVP